MTVSPLAMPWFEARLVTTAGGPWPMVMPFPSLDRATFGLITIPCLIVLMDLSML